MNSKASGNSQKKFTYRKGLLASLVFSFLPQSFFWQVDSFGYKGQGLPGPEHSVPLLVVASGKQLLFHCLPPGPDVSFLASALRKCRTGVPNGKVLGYLHPALSSDSPRKTRRCRQGDSNFPRAALRRVVKRKGPEVAVVIAADVASLFPILSSSGSSRCFHETRKKSQNEEVLTHRAAQIQPQVNHSDGQQLWDEDQTGNGGFHGNAWAGCLGDDPFWSLWILAVALPRRRIEHPGLSPAMIPGKYRSVSGRAANNVSWAFLIFFPFK